MALFWAADAFALWAGLAAFGTQMNAAALTVGFCTGMVFSRRIGPLAGAGILALILPLTLWVSAAPLAAAVAGVFCYRVLSLWLPLPAALAFLPTLRTMGDYRGPGTCAPLVIEPCPGEPLRLARIHRRAAESGPARPRRMPGSSR